LIFLSKLFSFSAATRTRKSQGALAAASTPAVRRERPLPPDLYQAEDGWDRRLHELLGVPSATSEFTKLWSDVTGELEAKGIRVGPEVYRFGMTVMQGWSGQFGV
jgi:hypothetical protein